MSEPVDLAKRALAEDWYPDVRTVVRSLAESVLALTAERDRLVVERDEARNRLKFTHPVFNNASKGPVRMEPESSLPGFDEGVFRIVREEDARRFREDYQTTARPPYLATVYNYDDAVLCKFAFNEYENTLRGLVQLTAERDQARSQLATLRAARDALADLARDGWNGQTVCDDTEVQARIAELRRVCGDE